MTTQSPPSVQVSHRTFMPLLSVKGIRAGEVMVSLQEAGGVVGGDVVTVVVETEVEAEVEVLLGHTSPEVTSSEVTPGSVPISWVAWIGPNEGSAGTAAVRASPASEGFTDLLMNTLYSFLVTFSRHWQTCCGREDGDVIGEVRAGHD